MSGDGMNPPFKWFGGKRRVADYVWSRFGETGSYIEPFLGSGAVFVRSPGTVKYSVLNDKDCLVANFWRAAKREPEALAEYVSDISHEAEFTARHVYICERLGSLAPRVMADPDYFDLRIAGYWFYAISQVVGNDFAKGTGRWGVRTADDGTKELVDSMADKAVVGIVPKQRQWEKKKIKLEKAREITASIFKKLESAVILCGAWERAVTPVNFRQSGVYSIFLDPPYSSARTMAYRTDGDLREGIMRWCRENGAVRTDGSRSADTRENITSYRTPGGRCMRGRVRTALRRQERLAQTRTGARSGSGLALIACRTFRPVYSVAELEMWFAAEEKQQRLSLVEGKDGI